MDLELMWVSTSVILWSDLSDMHLVEPMVHPSDLQLVGLTVLSMAHCLVDLSAEYLAHLWVARKDKKWVDWSDQKMVPWLAENLETQKVLQKVGLLDREKAGLSVQQMVVSLAVKKAQQLARNLELWKAYSRDEH
jgi:hypothetical protein